MHILLFWLNATLVLVLIAARPRTDTARDIGIAVELRLEGRFPPIVSSFPKLPSVDNILARARSGILFLQLPLLYSLNIFIASLSFFAS